MKHIKKYPGLFENFEHQSSREDQLGEAVSIQDLSPRDERPMVEGIASILRKVRDVENRKEIADAQIREFGRDGIRFDYAQFLKLCGL